MKKPAIQYVAVKALIKNDEGKVLVLKQSDSTITGSDQYHPPGGIVEPGESVKECVVREVEEEIGVVCEVKRLVDIGEWYAERGDSVMQFVGIFYECTISNNNFRLQATEIADIAWVGVDELNTLSIMEPSKSIIERFLQGE